MMEGEFLFNLKNTLRKRLSGVLLPKEIRDDLKPQQNELTSLLRRTVEYGESNSVLVVGMKGSGKSLLVKRCLNDLCGIGKQYLMVQLNGFLQTDDRIALDEITRQLHLENTLGDRVFGTFAETLAFLLEALRGGDSESLPILFILEEFDLFAHHKNQTLLYNLLDITQAGLTPMAVVGITSRIDVMELLEKRVKSRFSHRQFFVCNRWSFDDYVDGFVNLLHFSPESKKKHYKFKSQYKQWNSNIQKLSKDPSVIEILKKQFHISKETPGLQALLTLPVAKLSDNHTTITVADIADSERVIFADSKLSMLRGVTMLELCLIIAMNHLSNIHSGKPFNFQMVYNEFLKFSQKKSHVLQNYSKAVVFKAYEHLVELEFLQPKDNRITTASKVSKDYRPMLLLITDRQLKEAIDKYPDCNTDVKQWAESSFI